MIYTSYFAKLRKIPEHIIPISICAKPPIGYKGARYTRIAPSFDILMEYKESGDAGAYTMKYQEKILASLNAKDVVSELDRILLDETLSIALSDTSKTPKMVLVCFEKSSDFCHRHIVAEWLRANGYECKEWEEGDI